MVWPLKMSYLWATAMSCRTDRVRYGEAYVSFEMMSRAVEVNCEVDGEKGHEIVWVSEMNTIV